MDVAWHQLVLKYHQRNPLKLKNKCSHEQVIAHFVYDKEKKRLVDGLYFYKQFEQISFEFS